MIFRCRTQLLPAALFVALFSNVSGGTDSASGEQPAAGKSVAQPARKNVKLPGLVINLEERCVDIESTVCLDRGFLECVACTKETKEHESIVMIEAKAMHIHTALLLLGVKSGNPAMRRLIDKQKKRWINVPPQGDPVDVYLVLKSKEGKAVEHPISDFVARSEEQAEEASGDDDDRAGKAAKFPNTFVFAGSHLLADGPGPRKYLADHSGHVISIATFGDELLCLPGVYGHDNGSLLWQVNAAKLPKVGTKVTLRLRPQLKPAARTGTTLPKK